MSEYHLEKGYSEESTKAKFINYSNVQDFYFGGYRVFPEIIQCDENTPTQFCVEKIEGRTLADLIRDLNISTDYIIRILEVVALQCMKLYENKGMIPIDRHFGNIFIETSGNIRQIDLECVAYPHSQIFIPEKHGFIGSFLSRTSDWKNPFGSIIRDFIIIINTLQRVKGPSDSLWRVIGDMETFHRQRARLRLDEVEEHNPILLHSDYGIDDFLISLQQYKLES